MIAGDRLGCDLRNDNRQIAVLRTNPERQLPHVLVVVENLVVIKGDILVGILGVERCMVCPELFCLERQLFPAQRLILLAQPLFDQGRQRLTALVGN